MARAATAPDHPLTEKQLAFIERYLVHFNGSQAAIEAGYAKSRARQTANDLLASPAVQYHMASRRRAVRDEIQLEASLDRNRILLELVRIAYFDIRKLYGDDGELLPVSEWPDDAAAAVTSLESLEQKGPEGQVLGVVRKTKQESKLAALDKLMRHLGMFEQDNKQAGGALADLLALVRQKPGSVVRPNPLARMTSHDAGDDDDDE